MAGPPRFGLVSVAKHRKQELVAIYKICAGTDGTIASVQPISEIPGAEHAISTALRQWQLQPQPQGICTLSRFVFSIGR
jgi:hypothetical protein